MRADDLDNTSTKTRPSMNEVAKKHHEMKYCMSDSRC